MDQAIAGASFNEPTPRFIKQLSDSAYMIDFIHVIVADVSS